MFEAPSVEMQLIATTENSCFIETVKQMFTFGISF